MNNIEPNLCMLGTRVPRCFDSFEAAVRAVLRQQITIKSASTLAARIVTQYGIPVHTSIKGLTHVFPSPADMVKMGKAIVAQLGILGVISTRSKTVYQLAKLLNKGIFSLQFAQNPKLK